jgi:hypothetical protein
MAEEVHSAVLQRCIATAVIVARDVSLPPPIPLPQVKIRKEEPSKAKAGTNKEQHYIQ